MPSPPWDTADRTPFRLAWSLLDLRVLSIGRFLRNSRLLTVWSLFFQLIDQLLLLLGAEDSHDFV
jgi:hypothetical protein